MAEPVQSSISPMQTTAYHVVDGPKTMYLVDANAAASTYPDEWSMTPWSGDDAAAARKRLADRRAAEIADAKAAGREPPPPLPEPPEPTPEEQAAIDAYNKDVAAAKERLAAAREKAAKEKAEADQIAADEALVAQGPPQPDPTIRRPFGRKGEPTPAERKAAEARAAAKAADERARIDSGKGLPAAGGPVPVVQTDKPTI